MSPFIASLPFQGKVTCDQEFFFFSVRRYRGIIGREKGFKAKGKAVGRTVSRTEFEAGAGQGGGG